MLLVKDPSMSSLYGLVQLLVVGLNSLIILGAWTIWMHRNDCVFNGAIPRLSRALNLAREEALLWSIAGAKGLCPCTQLRMMVRGSLVRSFISATVD
jgi:hypothetical protein